MRTELLCAMEHARWPPVSRLYDPNTKPTDAVRERELLAIYMDEQSWTELRAECTFSQFSLELQNGRFRGVMIYRVKHADLNGGRHLYVRSEEYA